MTFAVGDDLVQEFAFDPHLGRFTRSIQEVFVSKKNQKRRSEMLPVLHPDAAGVDVGAEELFVAVPTDRDSQPVRRFSTFTRDLLEFVGMAETMRHSGGCDGVDQCLLDSALPDSRNPWL
jgi:hypothetical protein